MASQLDKEFRAFEQSRSNFVRMIAEAAGRAENIERLMTNRVLYILHPLLLDDVPGIQQNTALALGRLANYDEEIADQIVTDGILADIVNGLSSPDLAFQKNSCFVVRTVGRHDHVLAERVVECGVLEPLVCCLQNYDIKVRQEAALALGTIAQHTSDLAQSVVDAQAVPILITSAQSNVNALRRIAIAALGDIAKHSADLAQVVIDTKGVAVISPLVRDQEPRLKTVACSTLAHIAKHSPTMAELVANSDIFPHCLLCLRDNDAEVRKSAATLIREIVKHTQELAQRVINEGGAIALVQYLKPDQGNDPINGVMAIGYIASFSHTLATSLLQCGAADVVLGHCVYAKGDQTKTAAAWALGQLGKHTTDTAAALAKLNVLVLLLDEFLRPGASKDLVAKSERAMELITQKCTMISALEPLIERAPESVQVFVLEQISKLLPKNKDMRVPFIESGGFAAVQKVKGSTNPKISEYIDTINACYPDQAVKYYSPDFASTILTDIEQYNV